MKKGETERNVAIDKVIEALKKQEKEEKRRLADQELAEKQDNQSAGRNMTFPVHLCTIEVG